MKSIKRRIRKKRYYRKSSNVALKRIKSKRTKRSKRSKRTKRTKRTKKTIKMKGGAGELILSMDSEQVIKGLKSGLKPSRPPIFQVKKKSDRLNRFETRWAVLIGNNLFFYEKDPRTSGNWGSFSDTSLKSIKVDQFSSVKDHYNPQLSHVMIEGNRVKGKGDIFLVMLETYFNELIMLLFRNKPAAEKAIEKDRNERDIKRLKQRNDPEFITEQMKNHIRRWYETLPANPRDFGSFEIWEESQFGIKSTRKMELATDSEGGKKIEKIFKEEIKRVIIEAKKKNLENIKGSASQSATFDEEGGLPSGWKTRIDTTKGRRLYYNREKGIASWDRPKIASDTLKEKLHKIKPGVLNRMLEEIGANDSDIGHVLDIEGDDRADVALEIIQKISSADDALEILHKIENGDYFDEDEDEAL